jgi:hypothetical protein
MPNPVPEPLAGFITSHISIHVAACPDGGVATLARGLGCRIAPSEPTRVRVLLAHPQALPVLEAIRANGRIAVVLNEPESHRTVQLKGNDARIDDSDADDHAALAPYRNAMAQRLKVFDTPEPFVHAILSCAPDELVTISFTPEAVFGQTPGPRAGASMAPDAPLP